MGRDARDMQGCLSLSADMSPDKWSMQFIHDQRPQNKMSCEAPRKPAKNPHHDGILGAAWPHSRVVFARSRRSEAIRYGSPGFAALPALPCHVCQAVPAFPLRTNCHPSSHARPLHALRSAHSSATVSKGIARPPAQGSDQRITSHPTGETTKCRTPDVQLVHVIC